MRARQTSLFAPESLPVPTARFQRFYSGANDIYDAWGIMMAGAGVGVSAREVRALTLGYLALYVRCMSGSVFVDSGAFTDGRRGVATDFQRAVFPVYDRLLRLILNPDTNPVCQADRSWQELAAHMPDPDLARVFIVAPDRVGDQAASLTLLEEHRLVLDRYLLAGVSLIVPLQTGALSLADAYRQVCARLGTDRIVAGVPSQDAAVSPAELERFLAEVTPERIHFLGLGTDRRRVNPRVQVLERMAPEARLSCDANRLRAHIGTGRRLTDIPRERAARETGFEGAPVAPPWAPEPASSKELDDTELLGAVCCDADWMSDDEIRQLAGYLGLDPAVVGAHHRDGTLGDYLDSALPDPRILDLAIATMRRRLSHAEARSSTVAALIRDGVL